MASVILGNMGAALGGAFGTFGSTIGSTLGKYAGNLMDDRLQGNDRHRYRHHEGVRLDDIRVQGSSYGAMIPIVYGTMRMAGNIIWARPIQEHIHTSSFTQGGGKFGLGPKMTNTSTDYSYTITMAIAICEGPIASINRVWADQTLLDLSLGSYRIYKGTEEQLPDPIIEAFDGIGVVPAYRGLAYVVMEDFPLTAFGNSIPGFVFEVTRQQSSYQLSQSLVDEQPEQLVKAITLIPGSGEFTIDTVIHSKRFITPLANGGFVPQGKSVMINQHTLSGQADIMMALDQLQQTFPNLEWVALVVCWFGTSLTMKDCLVVPCVENGPVIETQPESWQVGKWNRSNARQISRDTLNQLRYGGTYHDGSVTRVVEELKKRNLKIMFYPMLQMDIDGKPWRGDITGSIDDIHHYFYKTDGYNEFIMHYANLVKGKVDGFIIGSELKGMTSLYDETKAGIERFPAAQCLSDLASHVKMVLGAAVTITYAADWSEYHSVNGWYTLDDLWASAAIDVVGIDAYFPLTTGTQDNRYLLETIKQGWVSGEGYDFFYLSQAGQSDQQIPYTDPKSAWKNITYWWQTKHYHPDGSPTPWLPQSKKIWFTEYGFPSVDACSNQPNRFIDPSSVETNYPTGSSGLIDCLAQRAAITATELMWQHSAMVEYKFLWTWDARPYPYFPDLHEAWADGPNWRTGHWVQGKMGLSQLAAVVHDLLKQVGLEDQQIDVSQLRGVVFGYVLSKPTTAYTALMDLADVYAFDLVEHGNGMSARPRQKQEYRVIDWQDTILNDHAIVEGVVSNTSSWQLPVQADLLYVDPARDYQPAVASACLTKRNDVLASVSTITNGVPLVLTASQAQQICQRLLKEAQMEGVSAHFSLPPSYITLQPGDQFVFKESNSNSNSNTNSNRYCVREIVLDSMKIIITSHSFEPDLYELSYHTDLPEPMTAVVPTHPSATEAWIFEMPTIPQQKDTTQLIWMAMCGTGPYWPGAQLYVSADGGNHYEFVAAHDKQATMGYVLNRLSKMPEQVWDEVSQIQVSLIHGALFSANKDQVLLGSNLALVGDELIQFCQVQSTSADGYLLSRLLRGRYGTGHAISNHQPGERFILITPELLALPAWSSWLGQQRFIQAVSKGSEFNTSSGQVYVYQGKCLKPLAPVYLQANRLPMGDIFISWIRRSRIPTQWVDGVDMQVGEAVESYEVDVFLDQKLVRTIPASQASVLYSKQQQDADFIQPPQLLTFKVYQISAMVGRGECSSILC
ncbi:MAG: glycoside hydrolase TIM-barrel-like domain-containing protein [Alphaproteobacteria bacterium]|nr:glycoside hydrolase TIM-barrel-like domain-containing protein [Alphaproteobacteria bacterium]